VDGGLCYLKRVGGRSPEGVRTYEDLSECVEVEGQYV
jgi:hypothetical protein